MFNKIFAFTFQEMTHKWFVELPPKSIISFNQLVKAIITNYACCKPIWKESHIFSPLSKKMRKQWRTT